MVQKIHRGFGKRNDCLLKAQQDAGSILLTHPQFPQLSSSRPRRRRAVHFSRLFTGECESSRLLFLGCRERPEGLFRGRSCFFCGLRPAGWWVRGPKRGENTRKCGRETKNAESSHSRRFGVWCWVLLFRRTTKSSPKGTLFMTPRKMSRPRLPMNYASFKLAADWQRHRLHIKTRRHHPFLLPPSRIKSPRPSSHSELDCAHRPR